MKILQHLKTILRAAAVACLFGVTAAWTFPVTLSAGQSSEIFNFDESAFAPLYGIGAGVHISAGLTAGQQFSIAVFQDIDGAGGSAGTYSVAGVTPGPDFSFAFGGGTSGAYDGLFSVQFSNIGVGSIVFDDLIVNMYLTSSDFYANPTRIYPTNPNQVPEPSSIALLGAALLGVVAIRRSRAS